jgi:hypothetical protein
MAAARRSAQRAEAGATPSINQEQNAMTAGGAEDLSRER